MCIEKYNAHAGITIVFTESEYTIQSENGVFSEVCATITDGEIDRDVSFSITSTSNGGTASSELLTLHHRIILYMQDCVSHDIYMQHLRTSIS